jgi:hypothetical protein
MGARHTINRQNCVDVFLRRALNRAGWLSDERRQSFLRKLSMRPKGNPIATALRAANARSFARPGERAAVCLVTWGDDRTFRTAERSGDGSTRRPD